MQALSVARCLIRQAKDSTSPNGELKNITPLKLQKILYYAQGWYLANKPEPLFREKIWAWKYGPVVREVYDYYRVYSSQNLASVDLNLDTPCEVSQEDHDFLDSIWTIYGVDKADRLVNLTHNSEPWLEAISNPYSDEITQAAMRRYFRSLLDA